MPFLEKIAFLLEKIAFVLEKMAFSFRKNSLFQKSPPGNELKPTDVAIQSLESELKPADVDKPSPINEPIKIKVINSFNLDLLQSRYPKPFYPVCEDYKRSNCRHGRDGQTEVNGEQCQNLHPKKSFRWCKSGKNEKRGCTDGEDCPYYHPVICRNSIRYRKCLKPECSYAHLQNTERYSRRNTQYEDHRDYYPRSSPDQLTKEASGPSVAPWARTTSSSSQKNINAVTRSDKSDASSNSVHFLAELIQSLRKDMDSMKTEMKSEMSDFKRDMNKHTVQNDARVNLQTHSINPQHMQPNHLIQKIHPQVNTLEQSMHNMQNPSMNTQHMHFDPNTQRIIPQFHPHHHDQSMPNMQLVHQQMLQHQI